MLSIPFGAYECLLLCAAAEAIAAVVDACKDGANVVDVCRVGDDVIQK